MKHDWLNRNRIYNGDYRLRVVFTVYRAPDDHILGLEFLLNPGP